MKWKEIKEKYPKGWERACKWGFAEGWDTELEEGEMTFDFYPMNFFYFFDEQGIVINIESYVTPKRFEFEFWIDSLDEKKIVSITFKKFKSRKEAEEQAFLKAFELLEEQS